MAHNFKPGDLLIRTGYCKDAIMVFVQAIPDKQGNTFWAQTLDRDWSIQTGSIGVIITYVSSQPPMSLGPISGRQTEWNDFYIILIEETLIAISAIVVGNFFASFEAANLRDET